MNARLIGVAGACLLAGAQVAHGVTKAEYLDLMEAAVSAYSDTLREPVFNPSDAQFPVISSHVYTSAYVNPYPAG